MHLKSNAEKGDLDLTASKNGPYFASFCNSAAFLPLKNASNCEYNNKVQVFIWTKGLLHIYYARNFSRVSYPLKHVA